MSRKFALGVRLVVALCLIELVAVAVTAQETPLVQEATNESRANDLPAHPTVTVNIPFEFWIGPQRMPAGQYLLQVVVPSVAIIRSADGKLEQELFTVDIGPAVAENEARLVFVTRNGKSELTELWSKGGKRRLTSELTADTGDGASTKAVALSYH